MCVPGGHFNDESRRGSASLLFYEGLKGLSAMSTDSMLTSALQACNLRVLSAIARCRRFRLCTRRLQGFDRSAHCGVVSGPHCIAWAHRRTGPSAERNVQENVIEIVRLALRRFDTGLSRKCLRDSELTL
jgi:hypothetical protein